eukprot:s2313_g4.t1
MASEAGKRDIEIQCKLGRFVPFLLQGALLYVDHILSVIECEKPPAFPPPGQNCEEPTSRMTEQKIFKIRSRHDQASLIM